MYIYLKFSRSKGILALNSKGIRTHDLYDANALLYQVRSYEATQYKRLQLLKLSS